MTENHKLDRSIIDYQHEKSIITIDNQLFMKNNTIVKVKFQAKASRKNYPPNET